MSRTLGIVVLLAALAGVGYLLLKPTTGPEGGPAADGATEPGDAPGAVGGPGGRAAADAAAARAAPALAAAGRRPERVGRGVVAVHVARARGGTPVEGAALTLSGTGYGGESVAVTATTDAKGLASLAGVPAGLGYALRVDAAKDGAVTRPDVEVRAGRTTDVGTVLVGAVVGIEGRVVDERGEGIAGADVRALVGFENPMEMLANMFEMFTSMGREPTPLSKTTAGADGRFVLADVPPGSVVVRATAPGRRMGTAKVKADAENPPAPVTVKLGAGADVVGVVVGDRGAPVEGATVAIMRTDGGDEMMDWMAQRIFATTGAGGRFEAIVTPETKGYRAIVEADGYPTTVGPAFAAGAKDVRIVLERGADLEVTLLTEGDDQPVAGATVSLMVGNIDAGEGSAESGAMPSAVTDAAGVARISARPGKVQMLLVMAPGRDFMMAGPRGGMGADMGGLTGDVPTELKAGAATKVTMRIKTAVVVSGTVRAADGTPVAGCEVRSLSFFGGAGKAAFQTDAEGAYKVPVTSMFGNAGAMLSFRAPGFVAQTTNLTIDETVRKAGVLNHDVKLQRAATLRGRVTDPDGKPVAGARVSVEGGGGAGFQELLGGPSATVLTAKDGAYVLEGVGPSGEAADPFAFAPRPSRTAAADGAADETKKVSHVLVEAEGFVPARSEGVTVREGAQVDVPPVRLSRGATVRGTVLGPDRRPAAGAKVELVVDPSDPKGPRMRFRVNGGGLMTGQRTLVTDDEGRFEASACEVGTATVTVSAAKAAATRKTLKLETEDAQVATTVELRPAASIDGVVLDDAGKPVAGVRVAVEGGLVGRDGDDAYVAEESVTTKADGRFVLEGLPPGTVSLAAYGAAYRPSKTTAATGASVEIRLVARSPADARRLQEIQKELGEVGMRFMNAKDDKEREAIQKRMMELSQEQQQLQGDGPIRLPDDRPDDLPDEEVGPVVPEEPTPAGPR